MEGMIFSLEEFSVYDGPGIRSTVFLKGCPLSCTWCHNPEGQSPYSEIVKSPNGCLGCGKCDAVAKITEKGRVYTRESINVCPRNLLRVSGTKISCEELVGKLMKNERILKNGGGVTFSGGEPFFQGEFLIECLEMLKGKLHTAVQTSGFAGEDTFKKALELADYFLFDLKLADSIEHKKFTGVSNEKILRNFVLLKGSNKDFVTRIPLIPGVTDTRKNITGICEILAENEVGYAELLPYNKMAGGKYKMLGRKYTPGFDETAGVCIHNDIFKSFGIKIKVM